MWYTDDSEALLGILSGGCADEWGSAAPGEAPPVISAHVEQWAAHPALPSPNKESKGAASSTGVLTCDEIRKYEIGLFQTGREGE